MKNDSLTVFHCDPGRTGKILVGLCHRNDGIGINFRMILLLSLLYIIIAINQPIMLEKFGHKAYFWLADKMLTKGKPPLGCSSREKRQKRWRGGTGSSHPPSYQIEKSLQSIALFSLETIDKDDAPHYN